MPEAWLPYLSAGLVAALVARWSRLTSSGRSGRFTHLIGAALIVLAWHPGVWTELSRGYADDTLYNLSVAGRAGLVMLTVSLVLLLLYLSRCKSLWLQDRAGASIGAALTLLTADVLLTSVLFVVVVTIVPQLYYSYYLLLFDNLGQHWVIKPPRPARIWHSLQMSGGAGSSLHAIGFTGWWLLVTIVLSWLQTLRLARHVWWLTGTFALATLVWHVLV